MRVLVIGAGGHGHVMLDILIGSSPAVSVVGVLDDDASKRGSKILGVPVVGVTADLGDIPHDSVVVAIGDNRRRADLTQELGLDTKDLMSVVHPSAVIADSTQLGSGAMVCAGAVVNAEATIGSLAILNSSCTVEHHCEVGNHAHVAPGVRIGGAASVGEGVLTGIGSTILPGVTIGAWAIIGAGAVVTRDVPPGSTAVGVPARLLGSKGGRDD